MNGVDSHLAGLLLDKRDSLTSIAAAAARGHDEQLIDESIVAAKFEAETNGQNNVANQRSVLVEKPDAAEIGKREKLAESSSCRCFVKFDFARLLFGEAAHHWQERSFILRDSFTKSQLGHVHSPLCSISLATKPVHPV